MNEFSNEYNEEVRKITNSGLISAYEYSLIRLCNSGLPTKNIFDIVSEYILEYEVKLKEKRIEMMIMNSQEKLTDNFLDKELKSEAKYVKINKHHLKPLNDIMNNQSVAEINNKKPIDKQILIITNFQEEIKSCSIKNNLKLDNKETEIVKPIQNNVQKIDEVKKIDELVKINEDKKPLKNLIEAPKNTNITKLEDKPLIPNKKRKNPDLISIEPFPQTNGFNYGLIEEFMDEDNDLEVKHKSEINQNIESCQIIIGNPSDFLKKIELIVFPTNKKISTKLFVEKNQRLLFFCNGKWKMNQYLDYCGPEGHNDPLYPNHGALIGSVGDENFLIKNNSQFIVKSTGELFIYSNLNEKLSFDPSGSILLKIHLDNGPIPKSRKTNDQKINEKEDLLVPASQKEPISVEIKKDNIKFIVKGGWRFFENLNFTDFRGYSNLISDNGFPIGCLVGETSAKKFLIEDELFMSFGNEKILRIYPNINNEITDSVGELKIWMV